MSSTTIPLSLARQRAGHDDLTPAQRGLMVAAVGGLHVFGGWALLQVDAVREAARQVAPTFIQLIDAPRPVPVVVPPPPLPLPAIVPPRPTPLMVAAPSPAPAVFEVAAPPPLPPVPAPLAVAAVAAAPAEPAPPPPPPPAPQQIPASAVQYLELPQVEYPRLSRKNGENGLVVVRAYIDTAGGAPRSLQVHQSSGHARLDAAALAAVGKARFKPYTENGRAVEGWALIPIHFELEK